MLGHAKVSIADCNKCHFSTHPKTEMTLAEYLQYWQAHDACNTNLLYLKDWHFIHFPQTKKQPIRHSVSCVLTG